jgi:hypothetical protein
MTDREMLKLAARAIGATEYGGPDDCRPPGVVLLNGEPVHYEGRGEFGYAWAPHLDDGDALRLAVDLAMIDEGSWPPVTREIHDHCAGDWYAATRRAIVRAAAAIGQAMP